MGIEPYNAGGQAGKIPITPGLRRNPLTFWYSLRDLRAERAAMSDASDPRPQTTFPAEGAVPRSPAGGADPLSGDWSEGLRSAVRALGIPEPKLLALEGLPPPPPAPARAVSEPPPAEEVQEVHTFDGWMAPSEEPLQPQPQPAPQEAAPSLPDTTPPWPSPAFLPDATPPSPAPAFLPDNTPPSPAPAFVAETETPPPAAAFEPDVTPPSPAPAFRADLTPPSATPAFHTEHVVAEEVIEFEVEDASPAAKEKGESEASPWDAPVPASAHDAPTPWSESVAASPAEAPAAAADPWAAAPIVASAPQAEAPAPAADPWGAAPIVPSAPQAEAPAWDSATAVSAPLSAIPEPSWEPPAAPTDAAPVAEWKAEEAGDDWQQVKKSEAPPEAAGTGADWSALSSGPDWSAPPPASEPAIDSAWGAAPPVAVESVWGAPAPAAAEPAWAAPTSDTQWRGEPANSEPAAPEWAEPPPPPVEKKAAWNEAAVGASALEQLDSEPAPPEPGAAKLLFGAAGATIGGDEEYSDFAQEPVELESPEDVLRPIGAEDDPDLLVPVEESATPPARPAQPLAHLVAPIAVGALAVAGEHRVAVHTRGGRTRRGSIQDVDLSKSQFALMPQGGGEPETIYHAEVKAIFFMLAPGEKAKGGDGKRVRVTFADGRKIEGYRDGGEGKHGFFLVPSDAQRTNTRRIYIAREATAQIKDG
jgi:hypothetical protein